MRKPRNTIIIALACVLWTGSGLAQEKAKQPGVVDRLLDWSLRNAGIDPDTEDARNAKQLGKDWMNPFASQEQIDKDIQRIVESVAGGEEAVTKILDDPGLDSRAKQERLRSLLGNAKTCPHCKKVFPFDYLYCPYDRHSLHIPQQMEIEPLSATQLSPEMAEIRTSFWKPHSGRLLVGCDSSLFFDENTRRPKQWATGIRLYKAYSENGWYGVRWPCPFAWGGCWPTLIERRFVDGYLKLEDGIAMYSLDRYRDTDKCKLAFKGIKGTFMVGIYGLWSEGEFLENPLIVRIVIARSADVDLPRITSILKHIGINREIYDHPHFTRLVAKLSKSSYTHMINEENLGKEKLLKEFFNAPVNRTSAIPSKYFK